MIFIYTKLTIMFSPDNWKHLDLNHFGIYSIFHCSIKIKLLQMKLFYFVYKNLNITF